MMNKISPLLLSHLTGQIDNGRPLWAILTANEYLEASSPLRQALVTRAHEVIQLSPQVYSPNLKLVERILDGQTLAALPRNLKRQAKSIKEPRIQSSRLDLKFGRRLTAERICSRKLQAFQMRRIERRIRPARVQILLRSNSL